MVIYNAQEKERESCKVSSISETDKTEEIVQTEEIEENEENEETEEIDDSYKTTDTSGGGFSRTTKILDES